MDTIGKRLAAIRDKLGFSLSDVQEKVNINKSNLSRVENDKQLPATETLIALSNLYGISVDWILFGEGNITKEQNYTCKGTETFPAPPIISAYFNKLIQLWHNGDNDMRGWLKVQLRKAFPEIAEEIKKEQEQAATADIA
jgi:transcriptional regulator with XRE-family HTH domain